MLVLLSALLAAAQPAAPEFPGWMTGCWEQRSGEKRTEECWSRPRGGTMFGFSRLGSGDKVEWWEVNQIIADQRQKDGSTVRLAFWASPAGAKRTMFAWSPSKEAGLTFFNLANDYPQRIRYWRQGDDLLAEISLKDGSRAERFHYTRVKD